MERKSFYKKQTHQRLAAAILLWLGCCVLAFSQNTVTLTGGEGKPGEQVSVGLLLKNTDAITAMQVDVPLDESMTFVEGSETIERERLDGHEIKVSATETGFRILLYSLSLKPLKEGDEQLLTLKLKLKRAPGTYTLQPQVKLSGLDGKELNCHTTNGQVIIRAARMEVLTDSIDFGRIPVAAPYERSIQIRNTGNATLNISEITFSDSWLTGESAPVSVEGGSIGQIKVKFNPIKKGKYNGNISLVSDGLNGNQTIPIKAELYTVNELHLQPAAGISDEIVSVAVRLKNTEEISAVQFAVELPEELEYIPGSEQTAIVSHKANGTYRDGRLTLMVYSLSDAAIPTGDAELLKFQIKLNGESGVYNLQPSDVRIGNMKLENVCSAVYGSKVSISSPRIICNDTLEVGNVDMTTGTTISFPIQNAGSSALMIENIAFMDERFETETQLPIEIAQGGQSEIRIRMKPSTQEGDLSVIMNIYSNDPEKRMAAVNVNGHIYAPNTISLQSYPDEADSKIRLNVCMQNHSEITAFQMDIICEEGISLLTDSIATTSRLKEHELHCAALGNGKYRISCYSLTNSAIAANQGALFILNATVADTKSLENLLHIDNVKLSDALGINKYTGKKIEYETVQPNKLRMNLSEGWNWISCNLSGEKLRMAKDFITPIYEKVERLVGYESELIKDAQLGIVGQLENLAPETSYQILVNADVSHEWTGEAYQPENIFIALEKGWNWLGYVPMCELSLESALVNMVPEENDVIKSYESFSTYSSGKWTGTLQTMKPGDGYLYYSANGQTFHYPAIVQSAVSKNALQKQKVDKDELPWNIVPNKYPNNMTMIAELWCQGEKLPAWNYVIGAFVGDECRGIGQCVDDKIFMTIYGENLTNERITFRAYELIKKEETGIAENCRFGNLMLGTIKSPLKLTLDSQTGIADIRNTLNYVIHPNPVNTTLYIKGDVNEIRRVAVMNHLGTVVAETVGYTDAGISVTHINSGVYVVVLHTTKGVIVKKMIKR